MKRVLIGCTLFFAFAFINYTYPKYLRSLEAPLRLHRLPPVLALEIMSLGNRELLAEIIFFKTEFYFGEKSGWRRETPELRRIYDALNKATDLDPYNMDCYYLAQGTLSWVTPAIPYLNKLLEKGAKHRTWDWYLPYFLSMNYYFQLKDPINAAKYLREAARLKPTSELFASLTARMFYEGNQTEAAIEYLESMIKETTNPLLRKKFLKRLKALETIKFLENALSLYEKKFKRKANKLEDLVEANILRAIPPDPYGGMFYLTKEGKVYTTSKLAEGWQKSKNDTNKN